MPTIFALKRSIQELCPSTLRQRRLLERMSVGEFDEIPKAAIPYFRDVYDHFARVADRAEVHRDVITNALDAYLGVQSNRMNKTIKTLTLMSTLMLPLNLIAGIYGNFHHMPELSWQYGYPFALTLMVMVATIHCDDVGMQHIIAIHARIRDRRALERYDGVDEARRARYGAALSRRSARARE